MAIVHNGTVNGLSNNQLPSGYTRPTVTTFTDFECGSIRNLTVLKATVENATASTTMTNIIEDAAIGIEKQIEDILAADYLATATVEAYSELIGLSNNFASISGAGTYLKDTAASYTCKVKLFVKTS